MTSKHQPWEWHLAAASAVRLAAEPRSRWLKVTEGRVWLTRSGAGAEGDDVWLAAGQRHRLPAGTEWVAEGWPEARVEVLEAPELRPAAAAASLWRVWPQALRAV